MSANDKVIQIRTRKLGVLIKDARTAAKREVEECARALGITPDTLRAYEAGSRPPSLPELEALAYYLDIPLEHFWSAKTLSGEDHAARVEQVRQLNKIRNRIIGVTLRTIRTRRNIAVRDLAEQIDIPEAQLRRYEAGEIPIPLPELELLAAALDSRVEDFFDNSGPIGSWRAQLQAVDKFMELPGELRDFVCRPVNRPYLDLAMRLSALSVDRLRSVAEGLLEITY
ncbi:MAG TPA: helix-turn-helix transcriptional regulator [Anaerolineaceae bacterium]|jgi:transcriptional regulator with XRE-family HTH domain|nr:helix-turn-helix transcriptional regulator [Anaerolineaceae bacterium]